MRHSTRAVARLALPRHSVQRVRPSLPATPRAPSSHALPAPPIRLPHLAARPASAMAPAPLTTASDNPLLEDTPLPAFDRIEAHHVVPGIKSLLATLSAELDAIEAAAADPSSLTFDQVVPPLEEITDRLGRAWGAVTHLKAVADTDPLRAAVDEVQPDRVAFSLRLSQSKPLYDAFKALKTGPAWAGLTAAQRRLVDNELRDFELGGVGLEGDAKTRFNEIQQELSQLATQFSNNVLDATKAFKKLVTDPAIVDGLPPSALGLAAQQAAAAGHEGATAERGPWLLTLDAPSYMPILTHARNGALREEFYRAYITRASDRAAVPGAGDNAVLIERTLALRKEKAAQLGFDCYADLSMASKMATLTSARALLDRLASASREAAGRELEEVTAFAREHGFEGDALALWDIPFYAERLREARYDLTDEALRPYFALPAVLDGLFQLVHRLFGVTVEAADGQAPVWHPDVRFFNVLRDGERVASFYLDPYARAAEGKRGGAWMDEVVGRSAACAPAGQSVRLPIAHMVCNQSPPVGDKPSLMSFREVETLFHECGHALQHMLTRVDDGLVSGIRGVDWDAVELPSQFMENWCYDKRTLDSFARHVDTGAPLPDDVYQRMLAARTFRAGSFVLRQVNFAATDLFLHSNDYDAAAAATAGGLYASGALDAINAATTVVRPLDDDRFLCGFSHIFAGGYAAGYFSYAWAEVMSADAFAAFEEVGLEDESAVTTTGRRFADTVLALGGGVPPGDVFRAFRGRDPQPDAMLRHKGLAVA